MIDESLLVRRMWTLRVLSFLAGVGYVESPERRDSVGTAAELARLQTEFRAGTPSAIPAR